MKQKIVIKVPMNSQKCKSKAMKIAVGVDGVISVGIQGAEKDQLVVIGDGVDSANLTCSLRKRLRFATLLTVEEVKEKKHEPPIQWSSMGCNDQWPMHYGMVVCEPSPSFCSIL